MFILTVGMVMPTMVMPDDLGLAQMVIVLLGMIVRMWHHLKIHCLAKRRWI
jgi:hypothetical protein